MEAKKVRGQKVIRKKPEGDFLLLGLTLALSLFGTAMVFSASYYLSLSKHGNEYSFLKQDAMWMILGWIAFAFFAFFDYHQLKRMAIPALAVGFILLVLVFSPLGVPIRNARRWLDFKIFTVMPGEVIKFSLILFIAKFYGDDTDKINRVKDGIAPMVFILGIISLLIAKQPNVSTMGIVAMLGVGMMFMAGLKLRWVLLSVVAGAAGFAGIVAAKGGYVLKRVKIIFDPFSDMLGDGYQVVQSLLALGSGGVTGVGLGRSIQKALYLPDAPNDFILAIIGEELGLIGVLVLMAVYMLLIWRCFRVAIKAPDYYGMLLAAGVGLLLSLQVVLNIAVISASFFPTGVILPFISLGGNATVIMLSLVGICFNISRQSAQDE